ncbi:SDR family oxidoreductase [Cystobacter fuscus]|uniref:SDR family oxidoreductase n=1 Tax=Cystobacter fuscus TaxID=43 RepID=UPI002B30684C|nr:SDR family oxidoreductase [Cystobacter fuscus]
MKKLEGKVSIVTGAASGLGRSIARLFAAEGCRVVATDINPAGLESLAGEIRAAGGVVTPLRVDISQQADLDKMFEATLRTHGTLDILVNNAGVMDDFSPVGDVTDAMWERLMSINLTAPFRAMRSALRIMAEKKSGNIINIASVGGLQGARAGAAYTASKHAVIGLTKNTGFFYAKAGIRCNAIAPGGMMTNIAADLDMSKVPAAVMERLGPGLALNVRNSHPDEVARVALFLASEESSFVNGTVVTADGGWSAY